MNSQLNAMNSAVPPNLELQIKVSKILSLGFVFSLFWMAGVGSLISFISGLKARKIINQSNGKIVGIKMAWWCIIAGALGMAILPLMVIFR
ncbi:MAG: hypothetical protein ABI954_02415 [Pyrinomonadaceae bacterium]